MPCSAIWVVNQIKPVDLESYQAKAKKKGFADKTIDDEIGEVGTMIRKAFDNGMVGGDTLRTFNKVEKLMKKRSANARDKIFIFGSIQNSYVSFTKAHKGSCGYRVLYWNEVGRNPRAYMG